MDNSLVSPCPRSDFSSPISSDAAAGTLLNTRTHGIMIYSLFCRDEVLPADLFSKRNKRKASEDAAFSTPKISCCCHFIVGDLLKELETGKYGDVTKKMNDLYERRMASLKPFYKDLPKSPYVTKASADGFASIIGETIIKKDNGVHVHVDDDLIEKTKEPRLVPETCIQNRGTCISVEDDLVAHDEEPCLVRETCIENNGAYIGVEDDSVDEDDEQCQNNASDYEEPNLVRQTSIEKKGTYIGVQDDLTDEEDEQCQNNDAELADMFQEMTFALESCKILVLK